ncbi:hypothetical protein UABAM_05842 [Candidatus Uabimicrobium amorphum]|uniref:Uncharacterized protein n=1 Tax=Uabimicrobium amorphum TaxID=2596890 RepID=A0A5S9ISP3_UABAM|nr:hypothetical protein UABAM_05842 [Candidatus Uabimicrobium amorphum]
MDEEKVKYFIHCLAFFCMPLIIIRGIDLLFLTEKESPVVEFKTVRSPKTKTLWRGHLSQQSQIFLTPYSDSPQLNQFNDEVTSRFFEKKYQFCFLYIVHFGQTPLEFDPQKIICSINFKSKSVHNEAITPKNASLYLDILLNKQKIAGKALHKFLIAFDTNESILKCESIEFVWQEQTITTKKIVCLRNTFNEFLAKPTSKFFDKENN